MVHDVDEHQNHTDDLKENSENFESHIAFLLFVLGVGHPPPSHKAH